MDKRLEEALSFAKYRDTLNNQIAKLKIRTQSALQISKSGGTFSINRELITFLKYLEDTQQTRAVLIDDNGNPVQIDNVSSFLKEVVTKYTEVTNDYLAEYQEIRKSRSVQSILKINNE